MTSEGSERIRRRGGGGSAFGRQHEGRRNGHGVLMPDRIYVKRERARRDRSTSRTRSDGEKSDRYRRRSSGMGGMMYKNGIFGWPLWGTVKPRYVETRERWTTGRSEHGRRYGNRSDLKFNVGDD